MSLQARVSASLQAYNRLFSIIEKEAGVKLREGELTDADNGRAQPCVLQARLTAVCLEDK